MGQGWKKSIDNSLVTIRPWKMEQMFGAWLIKLLSSLRRLIKFLHCSSNGLLAGACTPLRTLFKGRLSDVLTFFLKSEWALLLILFIKSIYMKRCLCFRARTWNSLYEFCPRCDSMHKYLRKIQAKSFSELYVFDMNDLSTPWVWIIKRVGFAGRVWRRSRSIECSHFKAW